MTRILAVLVSLTSAVTLAQAVPGSISFNARLADTSGAPVTGAHALAFGLYDQATGGAAIWTESIAGANFSTDGLVYTELGATTALTASALDGRKLYLEVSVDGTTMTPRLTIVSVPYAIRASVAATASSIGSLTESNIQRRVTGMCSAGQALRSIDSSGGVQCEPIPQLPMLASVATSGIYSDLTGRPSLATVATSGSYSDLNGRPTLATVATTGAYGDLTGRPTLATVATSGDFNDLTNSPRYRTGDRLVFAQDAEQIIRENNVGTGYVMMSETSATMAGNLRVGFEAYIQGGPDSWGWQLTLNGVPLTSGNFQVSLHSSNTAAVNAYRRYQVDIASVAPGTRIGVWMKASDSAGNGVGTLGDQLLFLKRFRVYSDVPRQEGGVYTAATWRGNLVNPAPLITNNAGFAQFGAVEDGNPDVFEVVSTSPFGIRFKRAGHVQWQYDQDIIAVGGSYAWIRSAVTNKTNNFSLIAPTGGFWDNLHNSGVAQVTPGDVLQMEFGCSGCDITALDSVNWSNLSLMWMGRLDP